MTEFRVTPELLRLVRTLLALGTPMEAIRRRGGFRNVTHLRAVCYQYRIETTPAPEAETEAPPLVPDARLDQARKRPNGAVVTAHVAPSVVQIFEREAARRGTTAAILAARCLELVAIDDLFCAVLDR